MFESMNGQAGSQDWSTQEQYLKLRDFAKTAIDEINGVTVAEEEYYDEEGAEDGEGENAE